ncbi:hypothetical protein Asp14428_03360 [Actinoplanes sp. NBRC 14428]|nr:hypothetical protein Asp14428_03360 [Actinoplanes sp. NBRC 14428]
MPQQATGRRSALLRQRLIVLGGVAVLAFAGAGALFLAAGDDPPPRRLTEAGPTLPLPTAAGPAGTGVASAGAVRQSAASARGSRATSRPPSRTTTSAAAGTGDGPRDQPAPTGPGSPRPPSATLAPPPAADRTGTIASAGGRCLSLGGLLGIDGSPVQVAGCTGFTAQTFTLAADGTLRVSGRCAQVTDDGEVRSTGCDGRQSAQWRAGPGGSLVNPATGRCLSDPGTPGANTRVADCTGGADQRWTLP